MRSYKKRKKFGALINVLPMETIVPGVIYTFNLNKGVIKPTLMENVRDYKKLLNKYFKPFCKYAVVPELSKVGKLHYHGIITFQNLQSIFYVYRSLMDIGCGIEIDTIKDLTIWSKYMLKQYKFHVFYEERLLDYFITNNKSYKLSDFLKNINP